MESQFLIVPVKPAGDDWQASDPQQRQCLTQFAEQARLTAATMAAELCTPVAVVGWSGSAADGGVKDGFLFSSSVWTASPSMTTTERNRLADERFLAATHWVVDVLMLELERFIEQDELLREAGEALDGSLPSRLMAKGMGTKVSEIRADNATCLLRSLHDVPDIDEWSPLQSIGWVAAGSEARLLREKVSA